MKLLHFPENPTSIYIAAGVMSLASALSIIDLGLSAGSFSVGLITAVRGGGPGYWDFILQLFGLDRRHTAGIC